MTNKCVSYRKVQREARAKVAKLRAEFNAKMEQAWRDGFVPVAVK